MSHSHYSQSSPCSQCLCKAFLYFLYSLAFEDRILQTSQLHAVPRLPHSTPTYLVVTATYSCTHFCVCQKARPSFYCHFLPHSGKTYVYGKSFLKSKHKQLRSLGRCKEYDLVLLRGQQFSSIFTPISGVPTICQALRWCLSRGDVCLLLITQWGSRSTAQAAVQQDWYISDLSSCKILQETWSSPPK